MKIKRYEVPAGSTGVGKFRPPTCRAEGDESHDSGAEGSDNYGENSFP